METEFDELSELASVCRNCELWRSRTNVVFGAGSPTAKVLFVGEAPGRDEDEQGLPFVGRSGQLLKALLEEIDMCREDVYIANVLKCRPPRNRDPRPDEIARCCAYLDRQIELIDPVVVVTLGNFATRYLLGTEIGITRLRGRRFKFRNTEALIPTFHPAAALRGGSSKLDDMRADFRIIRRSIDLARPRGLTG